MKKEIGTERVHNNFGFFIPEVLLKIVCYEVNLILKTILLEFASCFTAHHFVATVMYAFAKTSV